MQRAMHHWWGGTACWRPGRGQPACVGSVREQALPSSSRTSAVQAAKPGMHYGGQERMAAVQIARVHLASGHTAMFPSAAADLCTTKHPSGTQTPPCQPTGSLPPAPNRLHAKQTPPLPKGAPAAHRLENLLLGIELLVRLGAVKAVHPQALADGCARRRLNQLHLHVSARVPCMVQIKTSMCSSNSHGLARAAAAAAMAWLGTTHHTHSWQRNRSEPPATAGTAGSACLQAHLAAIGATGRTARWAAFQACCTAATQRA